MMKKVSKDGSEYYYYYHKKVGRHKKSGRKKKKQERGRKWQEGWDYKIMQFDFRVQEKYIGTYHSMDEVYLVKKILQERNDSVVFPKKFSNNGRKNRKIYEYQSEYVVLKRVREENGSNVTQLRNEYGKFVDHSTTNKEWAVVDKFPCLVEETFWVYGHHPKTDRKTFQWIYDNLISLPSEKENEIILVYVYLNKVIFQRNEDFDFVVCKNSSDAIRMYNLIEEKTKRVRNVLMVGGASTKSERGQATVEKLMKKTGWTKRKVTSSSTRA